MELVLALVMIFLALSWGTAMIALGVACSDAYPVGAKVYYYYPKNRLRDIGD